MKHTPEKWIINTAFDIDSVAVAIEQDVSDRPDLPELSIASVDAFSTAESGSLHLRRIINTANAERIVNCVNSCKDITDPLAVPDVFHLTYNLMACLAGHEQTEPLRRQLQDALNRSAGMPTRLAASEMVHIPS